MEANIIATVSGSGIDMDQKVSLTEKDVYFLKCQNTLNVLYIESIFTLQ